MSVGHTIGEALELEHREIDGNLQAFRNALAADEVRREPFEIAAAALRRHIYIEEEELFPDLRAQGLYGPVAVMLREHAEIWTLIDRIEDLVAEAGEPQRMRELWDELSEILGAHNVKEEQILYPAADRMLAAERAERVHREIDGAELPNGWRSQGIPVR